LLELGHRRGFRISHSIAAILAVLNARSPLKEDSTNRCWYIGYALINCLFVFYGVVANTNDSFIYAVTSAGPLAMMFFVKVLNRRSYSCLRYLTVVPLVVGVALTYNESERYWHATFLDALTLLYLWVGVSGALLDRIKMRPAGAPSPFQMMAAINGWSAVCVTVFFVFFRGFEFLHFVTRYPKLLEDLGALTVVGVLSQIFIFTMVSMFGALSCVMMTTACKVVTTLSDGPFVERQWLGLSVAFVALLVDGVLLPTQSAQQTMDS
jgi:hypothetical protein